MRVSFVGQLVKHELGRQNSANIVRVSCVVEHGRRKNREICRQEGIFVVCSSLAHESRLERPAYTLWAQ